MTFESNEVGLAVHDLIASMSIQCLTNSDNSPDGDVVSIDFIFAFLDTRIIEITKLPDNPLQNPNADHICT